MICLYIFVDEPVGGHFSRAVDDERLPHCHQYCSHYCVVVPLGDHHVQEDAYCVEPCPDEEANSQSSCVDQLVGGEVHQRVHEEGDDDGCTNIGIG